jgi:hypothetical protein
MDGDIVVANWGVNDCTKYPAAAYRGYLRQLSGVTLFQTPIPILHERYDTTAYAQVMREVAAERSLPVADAHAAVLEVPHWRAMLSDGFHHPNDAMYRVIVGVLYPEVMRQVHAALAVNSSCTRK